MENYYFWFLKAVSHSPMSIYICCAAVYTLIGLPGEKLLETLCHTFIIYNSEFE